MTPFYVGMKVVCINDGWCKRPHEIDPVKGQVYTIRTVEAEQDKIRLRFYEIQNPMMHYIQGFHECQYNGAKFRPVHENRMDELRSLLVPTPSKIKELEES